LSHLWRLVQLSHLNLAACPVKSPQSGGLSVEQGGRRGMSVRYLDTHSRDFEAGFCRDFFFLRTLIFSQKKKNKPRADSNMLRGGFGQSVSRPSSGRPSDASEIRSRHTSVFEAAAIDRLEEAFSKIHRVVKSERAFERSAAYIPPGIENNGRDPPRSGLASDSQYILPSSR